MATTVGDLGDTVLAVRRPPWVISARLHRRRMSNDFRCAPESGPTSRRLLSSASGHILPDRQFAAARQAPEVTDKLIVRWRRGFLNRSALTNSTHSAPARGPAAHTLHLSDPFEQVQ